MSLTFMENFDLTCIGITFVLPTYLYQMPVSTGTGPHFLTKGVNACIAYFQSNG